MKRLNALQASSVRKLAESTLVERGKLAKEEAKLAAQQQIVDGIKNSLQQTDELIAAKTGGYKFDDLFHTKKVQTGTSKDGKPSYSNKVAWKYPETYLPSIEDDYDEMIEEAISQQSTATEGNEESQSETIQEEVEQWH